MFHQTACSAASHILLSLRPAFPRRSEASQVLPLHGSDPQAGACVPVLVLCRHRAEVVLCGAVVSVIASMIADVAVALHGVAMESARAAHACESCCPAP